jgi:hypothetical protein
MTDASRPGDAQLDELASAYLDGELDAAERERVERDPALSDRVAELANVRAQVAAPVSPLAADRREAMIRSAVAALEPGVVAPVVSISSRRPGRRILRVLAPVAAAAATIGAIAFIARDGDGGDESNDQVAFEASADTATAGAEGAERAAEGATVETTAASPAAEAVTNAADAAGTAPAPGAATFSSVPDLGAASSPSEVAALLRSTRTAQEESEATSATGAGEQDGTSLLVMCASAGSPVATLIYAGEQAIVVAVGDGLYQVLGAGCAVRAEFTSET